MKKRALWRRVGTARAAQVEQFEHILWEAGEIDVQRLLALQRLKVGLGHLELLQEKWIALVQRNFFCVSV